MGQHDKTHRVIYSLAINGDAVTPNRSGNAKGSPVRPRDAGKRLVDLRVGDEYFDGQAWRTVAQIAADDARLLTTQDAMGHAGVPCADGYVYQLPADQVVTCEAPVVKGRKSEHAAFVWKPTGKGRKRRFR